MASLFPRPSQSNGIADRINAIRGMVSGDPQAFAQQMMRTNPQFAAFVQRNQGKSPEQIAQENGLDWGAISGALNNLAK